MLFQRAFTVFWVNIQAKQVGNNHLLLRLTAHSTFNIVIIPLNVRNNGHYLNFPELLWQITTNSVLKTNRFFLSLTVVDARSLKSRFYQGSAPSESLGNVLPGLFPASDGGRWSRGSLAHNCNICNPKSASVTTLCSSWVSFFNTVFSCSYKDTSPAIGLRLILRPHLNFITWSYKYKELGLQRIFFGGAIQPITESNQ